MSPVRTSKSDRNRNPDKFVRRNGSRNRENLPANKRNQIRARDAENNYKISKFITRRVSA